MADEDEEQWLYGGKLSLKSLILQFDFIAFLQESMKY